MMSNNACSLPAYGLILLSASGFAHILETTVYVSKYIFNKLHTGVILSTDLAQKLQETVSGVSTSSEAMCEHDTTTAIYISISFIHADLSDFSCGSILSGCSVK